MARSLILACEMIEDEVRMALKALGSDERPPLIWVESGLHERPERLREVLQGLIDKLDDGAESGADVDMPSVKPGRGPAAGRRERVSIGPVEEAILALGFCGSALQGLEAKHVRLVFPRVDDCIALLLNRGCTREKIPRNPRHYYLTRGWLNHENTLQEIFCDWDQRYGSERAARLRKVMFAGYEQVSLIDTQAYEIDECLAESKAVAEGLDLDHGVIEGSIQLLERLFTGERGGEIVVVEPRTTIDFTHLASPAGVSVGPAKECGAAFDHLGECIRHRHPMTGAVEESTAGVGAGHCAPSAKKKGAKACTN